MSLSTIGGGSYWAGRAVARPHFGPYGPERGGNGDEIAAQFSDASAAYALNALKR